MSKLNKFTITYKDHLGRKYSVNNYAVDSTESESKFFTLYPDCRIVSID